jgi:hypothetical protein
MAVTEFIAQTFYRMVEALMLFQRVPTSWLEERVHTATAHGERDKTFGRLKPGDEIWRFSSHRAKVRPNTRPNVSFTARLQPRPIPLPVKSRPYERKLLPDNLAYKSGEALVRNGKVIRSRVTLMS